MTEAAFAALGVSPDVCTALAKAGIIAPFPVQTLVLPVAITGQDVLVKSPTGSGKTLAFGLPLIERLGRRGPRPAALILAPTRELASQIERELSPLAAARGLRMAACYGGVGRVAQAKRARTADILVATPGRLRDLTDPGGLSLASVTTLVIDEADRMLDMGFLPQVKVLLRRLSTERQTMFFSATLDGAVGELALEMSKDPINLRLSGPEADQGPALSTCLTQSFVASDATNRMPLLSDLLTAETGRVLVFCRTRRGADRLATRLAREDLPAVAMHGNLSQSQRERALARFRSGASRILVATDVAARGIDLEDIELVINFDPPDSREAYTHRVGRTARAGRTGRAVTLVLPEDAAQLGRIATDLDAADAWDASGYARPTARVVYNGPAGRRRKAPARSRRPAARPGPASPSGENSPRPKNRVKRGSRAGARPSA